MGNNTQREEILLINQNMSLLFSQLGCARVSSSVQHAVQKKTCDQTSYLGLFLNEIIWYNDQDSVSFGPEEI